MGHLMRKPRLVAIVDDDESVRDSLPELLRQFGYAVMTFASAEQFLASGSIAETQCMILDIGLPGISGPELQQTLRRRGINIPTIFVTGHSASVSPGLAEERMGPCLFKPFSGHDLRVALNAAIPESQQC
jgi:FixJ family two-component response regulator